MIPLPWRLGAFIVALLLVMAGLAWAVHEFNDLRAEAARVPGLEQSLRDAATTLETERAAAAKTQEISRGLQTDLTAIRAERDRLRDLPPRVVRVRVPVPAAVARPHPAAAGGSGSAAAGTLAIAGPDGPPAGLDRDIGADLYRIVDDADQREAELAAQVIRLQQAYGVAERTCNAGPP